MTGDQHNLGDIVRIVRQEGFKFNNHVGRVVALIKKEGSECQPYLVDIGHQYPVVTCSCHLDKEREPELTRAWFSVVSWNDCPWRPHLGTLPKMTFRTIIQQLEISQQRRKK